MIIKAKLTEVIWFNDIDGEKLEFPAGKQVVVDVNENIAYCDDVHFLIDYHGYCPVLFH